MKLTPAMLFPVWLNNQSVVQGRGVTKTQTPKTQTSDHENSDPENSDLEKSDPENSDPENSDPLQISYHEI